MSPRSPRLPRLLVLLLAGLSTVVATLGVAPGAAQAADPVVGTLTLAPETGAATTAMSLVTHATGGTGCPSSTSRIYANVVGPGSWAAGIDALSTTSTGFSTTADFTVPLSDTMFGLSQSNSAPIVAGRYDFTLFCRNNFGTVVYGTMTGSIWFTSATAYQSTDPAGTPAATPTTTALSVTPNSPAPVGATVTLTATVSPAGAGGTVQFSDGTGAGASPIGAAVPVSGGTATTETTTLAAGAHQLVATFVPSDPQAFAGSSAPATAYTVGTSSVPVLGTLAVDPPNGEDVTAPYLETTSSGAQKGCPAGTTNIAATTVGPGGWAGGIDTVSSTTNDLSTTSEMKVQSSDSWLNLATSNNAPLVVGRYDITLICRDRLDQQRFGTFTGSIWFTDATHYQSQDPASSATRTSTVLSVAPTAVTQQGKQVTLSATVTPVGAVGTVQFQDTVLGTLVPVGPAVPVQAGAAATSTSTLDPGMHSLRAVFVPADAATYETSTSDPVTYVISLPDPPTRITASAVAGVPRVGATLTCSAAYAGQVTYAYRWLRSGREITGATEPQRTLTVADLGYRMACRVFAMATGGTGVSTSPATVPVALGAAPRATTRPKAAGVAVPGRRLVARHGVWSPLVSTFHYQWRRDGHRIAGATGLHYRVRSGDRGHRISVAVRTVLPGYLTGWAASLPRAVRRARG